MKLVENIPLDTRTIAGLITDREDLKLVWPLARYPFDHDQWREVLNPKCGNRPFLVYKENQLIGHVALCLTEEAYTYKMSYLYLLPQLRSLGFGKQLIADLEQYALTTLAARKLILVVRTYNYGAFKCYCKCGFKEDGREGTLIRMSKLLVSSIKIKP